MSSGSAPSKSTDGHIPLKVIKQEQMYDPGQDYVVNIGQNTVDDTHLRNDEIKSFTWQGIEVTVKDHKTKQSKAILDGVDGVVEAGKTSLHLLYQHISPHLLHANTYSRGIVCFNGTFWLWKDDTSQCSCS